MRQWNRQRLFGALRVGDIERLRDALANGADPNQRDSRGRPALIAAVRALIPESGVVDALLEAGADAQATDALGLTALDHAKARLEKLTRTREHDRVRTSRALDADGNLVLSDEERDWIEQVRREVPGMADEFEQTYIQERRKAAVRQFMPRRELRIIVKRLENL